jgi:uncharacterized protein YijF (DUF1287 family)
MIAGTVPLIFSMIRGHPAASGPASGPLRGAAVAALLALPPSPAAPAGFVEQVIAAAVAQTGRPARYDGSYRRIPYPGGDVPKDVGVCTDIEDMLFAFTITGHYRYRGE